MARPRARIWAMAAGAGLCIVVLGAALLHRESVPPSVGKVPKPQPCTLGALPPGASADGGIIAVLVSSTYPVITMFPRFATPVPTRTTYALCVLRESDGAEVGHFGLDGTGLIPGATMVRVAPDGSAIYVASLTKAQQGLDAGTICALHPRSGSALWCDDTDAYPTGLLVARQDLYVCTSRSLSALDAATGTLRWRNAHAMPDCTGGVRLSGDLLIGVTGDDIAPTDEVCAWRISDGAVAWCTHTYQDVVVQAMAVDAGYVTMGMSFADNSGLVEQLSAQSGKVLWTQRMPTSRVSRIVDADGIVYVVPLSDCVNSSPTCQSTVLMLRAATGVEVGRFLLYGEIGVFTVSQHIAITGSIAPNNIAGMSVPGSPGPPVAFAFPSDRFPLGLVSVSGARALYAGPGQLGMLSFASGKPIKPIWEADSCGDALAGSATAIMRGTTPTWCHWPVGSRVMRVAMQGDGAGM